MITAIINVDILTLVFLAFIPFFCLSKYVRACGKDHIFGAWLLICPWSWIPCGVWMMAGLSCLSWPRSADWTLGLREAALTNQCAQVKTATTTHTQFFKKFNLNQIDVDLEIPCSAIQDHLIHFTCMPVLKGTLNWITVIQIPRFRITN